MPPINAGSIRHFFVRQASFRFKSATSSTLPNEGRMKPFYFDLLARRRSRQTAYPTVINTATKMGSGKEAPPDWATAIIWAILLPHAGNPIPLDRALTY